MGKLFSLLGSTAGGLRGSPAGNFLAKNAKLGNLGLALGLYSAVAPFGKKDLSFKEKSKEAVSNASVFALTLGFSSGIAQGFWSAAFLISGQSPAIMKGLVSNYRQSLENRATAAIPFSHSTLPMDQAFAALSYSQQRMAETGRGTDFHWALGNTAAFMSARYLSR